MKPIHVRFRCFGPYVEEQTVSFEELAEYGLFLICGETGYCIKPHLNARNQVHTSINSSFKQKSEIVSYRMDMGCTPVRMSDKNC